MKQRSTNKQNYDYSETNKKRIKKKYVTKYKVVLIVRLILSEIVDYYCQIHLKIKNKKFSPNRLYL